MTYIVQYTSTSIQPFKNCVSFNSLLNFNNNNNNNNNNNDNVYGVFTITHWESSPGSFDECRLSAGWPPTLRPSQPTWAASSPINGCYYPHPPSPFAIIIQPESWYPFYRLTEGGRLSRPRHCRKGAQPVPKAVHRSGCRDKHNWPRPLTPQSVMPPINHCDLQRHVGVNNLPKVVIRQCRDRELNSQPSSCKFNVLATRLPSHPIITATSLVWNLHVYAHR